MRAHVCPECGTEREHDGRPGCPCATRAAEAARAERSAETAASEDFDPLRLRPYVTLENVGVEGGAPSAGDPTATMPLRAVPGPVAGPVFRGAPGRAAAGGDAFAGAPDPISAGDDAYEPVLRPAAAPSRSRRRPLLLASVAAATILAAGTAAFAGGGLFGGGHGDSAALPDTTVSTLPYGDTPSAADPTPSPTASKSAHGTPSASPSPRKSSPTPSRTPGRSPSPSRKPVSATPSPSKATGSVDSAPADQPAAAPVLRRGDSGPEVAELQDRLAQLTIYDGNVDGRFGSRTERAVSTYQSYMGLDADPPGVYGPETRRALEAQTSGS